MIIAGIDLSRSCQEDSESCVSEKVQEPFLLCVMISACCIPSSACITIMCVCVCVYERDH